ncbi:maltose alpha-D-glucosyltransferase [Rubrobacter aplysinae]|uniref:maltose alpha-D-glucosyltransferase n=1 Tax=Rubrobacter aplysinae TaxID=909625 RepID=UPI000A6168AB|nr:maltose alpha-D-glucosyltransferase [Rubrobacter aplysinae]
MSQEVSRGAGHEGDPQWYKDAIIYHLHVKAFFDSDNNGIGDFKGLTQRLEYIKDLGATAIWIMPYYPSPLRDDGYDIAEYKNVHADYGTKRDFRQFVRKAHELGLKVITELVINHTSDQHPWFQKARNAPKGSARRNYYVWSDTPDKYQDARIIFTDTENSNWTWDPVAQQYYWHRFFSHQPDLNHDNPQVFKSIMNVMRFWLDAGVDGLRLDAIPYLIEREGTEGENLPETHEVLKKMRAEMDAQYEDRFFLAEANQWPEDVLPYFGDFEKGGDECHMAFHFPLMPRIYMAVAQEDRHPIVEIMSQTPAIPEESQWAIFLRNHDELTLEMVTDRERDYMYETYASDPQMRINLGIRRRLATLMQNDRPSMELLNSILFSMPGTPIIYYGDEIGMGDNVFLGDRDAVRTPMQWTSDRNAGFSRAEPARMYLPPVMDPVYGYQSVNVESQSKSPNSLLNWMRRIIAVRKAHKAFGRGTLEFLHPGNRKVLAYLREYDGEAILCVANLSRSAQPVELDLSRFAGRVPVELIGGANFPNLGTIPYMLTLPGRSFYWFALDKDAEAPPWHLEMPDIPEPPVLVLSADAGTGGDRPALRLQGRHVEQFEREALPGFLGARRWFAEKAREIESVKVLARAGMPGPEGSGRWALMLLEVRSGGVAQHYFVPLSAVWEDGDDALSTLRPYTLAKLRRRSSVGVLYDAMADDRFCHGMVQTIGRESEGELGDGVVSFTRTGSFEDVLPELAEDEGRELGVRRVGEQTNTSVILDEKAVLKAYRRLQWGVNPDLEIGRYLTEETGFENTPPIAGAVEYAAPDGETATLAVLQGFALNQGDGWTYALDFLSRYLEDALVTTWSPDEAAGEVAIGPETETLDTFFLGLMRTLGRRTGELHAAFASPTDDPAFSPEPLAPGEAAGWVESVIGELGDTVDLLQKSRPRLPDAVLPDADRLLHRREELEERIRRVRLDSLDLVKTRYHGDYHLGQVLVSNNDFQIIDFEGEPDRPLEERRRKHSPLRDVAGMLRSFNYAARSALTDVSLERMDNFDELSSWAALWERRVREEFLAGYDERASGSASYPEDPETARLLIELFTLEKALYEVRYEMGNRPDWVGLPIRGILELLDAYQLEETE